MSAEADVKSVAAMAAGLASTGRQLDEAVAAIDGGAANWKVEEILHCLACGEFLAWIPKSLERCFCDYHQQEHNEMSEEEAEAAKFEAWHDWLAQAKAWADGYQRNQQAGSTAQVLPVQL